MRRFVLQQIVLPQAIVATAAVILAFIPLFDVLGFESSVEHVMGRPPCGEMDERRWRERFERCALLARTNRLARLKHLCAKWP